MFGLISRLKAGGSLLQVLIVSAFLVAVAAIAGASPGIDAEPSNPKGDDVSLSALDEATPTATPDAEPSESPLGEPSGEPVTPTPQPSDDGDANHGTYVSKVAHCVPPGPSHGEAVREMAQTHENEAAKADEICSRYGSASPSPVAESGDGDAERRGHPQENGKANKSGSPGNSGKKGKSGGR